MANIPLPENALKCPRCESTNTKFCYFNNYSLSQPRHFCKTCRRYWTRGGALRNVPVGGGCRRNKRSKGSSSKSPVTSDRQTGTAGSSSTLPSNTSAPDIIGLSNQMPPLRLMAPLHQLTDFAEMGLNYSLNYGGMSAAMTGGGGDLNFQIGSNLGRISGGSSYLSGDGMDQQWRLQQAHQQFPFMVAGGLDPSQPPPPGLLESGVEALGYQHHHVRPKPSTSGLAHQFASVKMEDNQQELNLSRQYLGNEQHQYWSGGNSSTSAWTDLSGFSSSSTTSNPL